MRSEARASGQTPPAKNIVAAVDGPHDAVREHGQGTPQLGGIAIHHLAVRVATVPRIGAAVARVAETFHTTLVTVVDAGNALVGHLEERREPKAALSKSPPCLRQASGEIIWPRLPVRMVERATQHAHETRAIMAREQVQRGSHGLGRIVLRDLHEALRRIRRADVAEKEVEHRRAERIVHRAVELGTQQVATQLAIADLVRRILPDLAQDECVRALGERGGLDVLDELVRQLVRYVEAPAARTGGEPVAHDALGSRDEVLVARVRLVHGRQVVDAPPSLVGTVVVEGEPVRIGRGGFARLRAASGDLRLAGLPGAWLGIGLVAVEVAAVRAHMVEDAVKDDRDAELSRLAAEPGESLFVTKHRVDVHEVSRVIAMAAASLEDRVQIDDGHAHVGETA